MPAASTNQFPKVILEERASDGSDTANPAADHRALFLGEDGDLHLRDSAGTVTDIGGGTPSAHAASHENGGSDEIDVTGLTGAGGGGATVATEDTSLSGDVTMVNANTFYDGPSESFAAGTWLINWKVIVQPIVSTSQTYNWMAKLWDGSTVYDEVPLTIAPAGNLQNEQWAMSGSAVVVLGSPTTLKVSVACIRGSSGTKIARNIVTNGAASNLPSRIIGYKVT